MQDIKSFLAKLSHHPGVYQMLDEKGEVIYVGKAKDLKKRVSSYFSNKSQDPKTESLVKQISNINVTVTNSENEAVLLECNLIKQFRPRYNILLRDDKSYPYILLTHHAFPRIEMYRGARKQNGRYFGPYASSVAVRESINLIQKIFKLRTCRDSYYDARTRPCLLYQIGRCTGPCVGLISAIQYAESVKLAVLFLEGKNEEVVNLLQANMETAAQAFNYELAAEYRDKIARLRQIQDKQYVSLDKGDADVIGLALERGSACIQLLTVREGQIIGSRAYYPTTPQNSSPDEIVSAFLTQHYLSGVSHIESTPPIIIVSAEISDKSLIENVLTQHAQHKVSVTLPARGEKAKWLNIAAISARQSLALHLSSKSHTADRMAALQILFDLPETPKRMECYDVSHTQGEATVASCVVFDQNGPVKSAYRRYNIKDITPGDDVAAMRQVLSRRFKNHDPDAANLPDIIVVDGGPTQLNEASRVLDEQGFHPTVLFGVSKGPGRKAGFETLHFLDRTPMHLPANSKALHLIQHIRDESHRFAITGHRLQRDKARRQSSLESIAGVGAKRRRELLRYFGGIQGIAHASLDELMKVPGINRSLAERIFAAFHDATI